MKWNTICTTTTIIIVRKMREEFGKIPFFPLFIFSSLSLSLAPVFSSRKQYSLSRSPWLVLIRPVSGWNERNKGSEQHRVAWMIREKRRGRWERVGRGRMYIDVCVCVCRWDRGKWGKGEIKMATRKAEERKENWEGRDRVEGSGTCRYTGCWE